MSTFPGDEALPYGVFACHIFFAEAFLERWQGPSGVDISQMPTQLAALQRASQFMLKPPSTGQVFGQGTQSFCSHVAGFQFGYLLHLIIDPKLRRHVLQNPDILQQMLEVHSPVSRVSYLRIDWRLPVAGDAELAE